MSQDTQEHKQHEVRMPSLYTGMPQQEQATIQYWYVEEGKSVQPEGMLLRVETLSSIINIPSPSQKVCRVVRIHKKVGDQVQIGDLLVTLAPMEGPPAAAPHAP